MQDDDVFVPGTEEQPALDNELIEPDWKTEWRGMPSYEHQDLMPEASLLVHFKSLQDRAAFARLVGQTLHSNTKFIWYPKAEIRKAADKVFTRTEKVTPRYPVYIISKGRWDSRLTSRSLEWLKVPYHIVVEPQEAEQYAKVIDPAKILTLPFSNLGLGGIPARNWVWEHAIATGAERHWILDDNIGGFCRFQDNLKVEVDNGATFCAAEDFVDRYENVVMAAFNYDYFAPRKQGGKIKPITLNTRCYSGILLSNKIPYRWRGRYNEDTDLSLRILKDGLCTVLFNALLMYKKPTLTMKGGNTDELYKGVEAAALEWQSHAAECSTCRQCLDGYDASRKPCPVGREILSKDGRWLMAESLREQHPDQVSVERKWGRWQHQVDYRRFVPRLGFNVPRLRPGIEIKDGADEYGMELDAMPQDEVPGTRPTVVGPGASSAPSAATPRPSVLDFVRKTVESPKPEAAQPVPVQPVQPVPAGPAAAGPVRAEAMASPQAEPEQAAGRPEAASEGYSAAEFRAALEARGHRLFVHEGRLFVTGASALSDVDRELMNEHRAALIALLEPPVVDSERILVDQEPRPGQSIAQFLGTEAPRIDPDWRPDEIPSHIDDKEIVLNFATSGLEWAKGDRPVGVTVGTLDGKFRRFLPFAFEGGGNLDEGAVKRFVKEVIRGKRITNANTRFDVHMARAWDVDLEEQGCTFSDVQHAAALLDDHRKQFRLDVLARDYLPDLPMVERVDESRHADYHASEVAKRELFTAELVTRLHAVMDPQIDEQELRDVQRLEDAVIPCVVEMERNGAPLNLELLEEYGAECTRRYERLLSEVAAEAGFAFDHTSKSWQRLFETLGLPATDSVKESVIGIIDHPLVKKAHLAAQYASLNSKTFKAYKENVGSDGILRFDINQLRGDDGGTVSGRFSIGYVQQVPNADNHGAVFGNDLFPRRLFVPGEGLYLESDARQIEYRLGAHHANNAKILAAYKENPLISYHEITWEMMKRYKPNMLYAHQKSFNFAKQYGARSVKLAIMMGFITEDEGAEIRATKSWNDPRLDVIHEIEAAYKQMMPEGDYLLDYAAHLAKPKCDESCKLNDDLHRNYQHRGYVKTLLGRRSRFPTGWKTYIGWNRVIQGTAADVMKQKLVELHRERKTTGFVMRLTIHDQVAGDATIPETAQRVGEILNHQSFPQLRVPILWTVKTGPNWADCK